MTPELNLLHLNLATAEIARLRTENEALQAKLAGAEALMREMEVILFRSGYVPKNGSLNPIGDWLYRANDWHNTAAPEQEPAP